jgi:adenine phosphoribosyltransferase
MEHLKALIRDVPDFPLPGILFRDVTPLLRHPRGLADVVDAFAARYRGRGVDAVVGIESRGFLFGAPLAVALGVGFVPVRKPGKLPADRISQSYELEYGTNTLEIHRDALLPGESVVVVDDLLATGGTAQAAASLVRALGAHVVELAFVVELALLRGRERLGDDPVHSLITD